MRYLKRIIAYLTTAAMVFALADISALAEDGGDSVSRSAASVECQLPEEVEHIDFADTSAEAGSVSEISTLSAASYKDWVQFDPAWSDLLLGGADTMHESGCLVMCLAKMMVQCGIENESSFTPADMLDWLNDKGLLDSSSSLTSYAGVAAYSSNLSYMANISNSCSYSAAGSECQSFLMGLVKSGYQIILKVSNSKYSSHFVIVDNELSLKNGSVYIMDSAYSANASNIKLSDRYSSVSKYVCYKGPQSYVGYSVDTTPPVISDVSTAVTSSGYTVTCTVTDDRSVDYVLFPTWTSSDGQDDLVWPRGTISGNTVTYTVRDCDHNYEHGEYNTHIYAYDKTGNVSVYDTGGKEDVKNTFIESGQAVNYGSTYTLFNDLCSYDEAEAKCEELGGHLATITEAGEQEAIASLIDSCGGQVRVGYWLGASDADSEGTFKWINDEEFSYTNWSDAQPDDAGGSEDHLGIYTSSKAWNDFPAAYGCNGFVCEQEEEPGIPEVTDFSMIFKQLNIAFETVDRAIDYEIWYAVNGAGYKMLTETAETSYSGMINDLKEGDTVSVKVRAKVRQLAEKPVYGNYSEAKTSYIRPAVEYFTDVTQGEWYYDAVSFVSSRNIMTGLTCSSFGIAEPVSRAQFAVILYRMEGSPSIEYTARFPDVTEGQFYTDAVLWASRNGIIYGYDNGYFGAADNLTREQLAVMMYRYARYKGYITDSGNEFDLTKYPDAESISDFAEDALKWTCRNDLIRGMGDGSLLPQGSAERSQCATIIMRFLNM